MINTLKIALLITGTTRNYKKNFVTWKQYLLDLFDVDIFFHTYDVVGYHDHIYRDTPNAKKTIDRAALVSLLTPKKYCVDKFSEKIEQFKGTVVSQCLRTGSPNPEFIKSQLYSIYVANELKKDYEKSQNFTYDFVIKIRFDTIFYTPFDILDIMRVYGTGQSVVLCGSPYIKTMKYKHACRKCTKLNDLCNGHTDVSDIVFMGKSADIDHYANIYNTYDTFITTMFLATKKSIPHNELGKYVSIIYKNNSIVYKNVPRSECPFPEKILPMHMKSHTLLEYTMQLDINREVLLD